jgi:hypothetical protein
MIFVDMYVEYWVRMMLFYKFLPAYLTDMNVNSCKPNASVNNLR